MVIKIRSMLPLAAWLVVAASGAATDVWTVIAVDPRGDGRDSSLADVAQLSYRYDPHQDMLWFRVSLYGKPNEDAFGLNIAVDTGAPDDAKMNWWGSNKDFRFDKLLTAWVTRTDRGYQGTIGVGDAAGVKAKYFNNLQQDNLHIRVEGDSILMGVRRIDLTDKMKMNLIAAVGSDQVWNDDIPNTRSAILDLSAPRPSRGLREIDVDRNNFRFALDYRTLADNEASRIIRKGRGRKTLLMIPGVYSGEQVFDGFMTRNESRFGFYVLTPPGLSGTPARPLPSETTSYGEFTWTRRLERDILDLIMREKLVQPILVVHGFPGSLAAEELATMHADAVGGIIELASMPVQFSPSPSDPSRKATPDQRIAVVNVGWAQKWFKYVTPETWESNNYPAQMFANDPDRAERARRQTETVPLPVKIRYLCEFMASDHTNELMQLSVPVLVLRPGFNEALLADPAYAWFKLNFLDSWDAFATNSRIRIMTIQNTRALMLDDQPESVDEAIVTFVATNGTRKSAIR